VVDGDGRVALGHDLAAQDITSDKTNLIGDGEGGGAGHSGGGGEGSE
jgi:hypothetical protein